MKGLRTLNVKTVCYPCEALKSEGVEAVISYKDVTETGSRLIWKSCQTGFLPNRLYALGSVLLSGFAYTPDKMFTFIYLLRGTDIYTKAFCSCSPLFNIFFLKESINDVDIKYTHIQNSQHFKWIKKVNQSCPKTRTLLGFRTTLMKCFDPLQMLNTVLWKDLGICVKML